MGKVIRKKKVKMLNVRLNRKKKKTRDCKRHKGVSKSMSFNVIVNSIH